MVRLGRTVAALVLGAGTVVVPATAHAQPAQCRYGENVTADCPPGGCIADASAQAAPCTGPELPPIFPPGPPVRVGIGFGVGDPTTDD
jgi:hypothetical protein